MKKPKKEKSNKISIFDFLKSITINKEDLSTHERFHADYNVFMMNKWLSMTPDIYCISMAMYLSSKDMDKLSHYKFLLYELPKKYVKFNYVKSKNEFEKSLVEIVGMYYNLNSEKSIEILKLLNEDQIGFIKKKVGGSNGKGS